MLSPLWVLALASLLSVSLSASSARRPRPARAGRSQIRRGKDSRPAATESSGPRRREQQQQQHHQQLLLVLQRLLLQQEQEHQNQQQQQQQQQLLLLQEEELLLLLLSRRRRRRPHRLLEVQRARTIGAAMRREVKRYEDYKDWGQINAQRIKIGSAMHRE